MDFRKRLFGKSLFGYRPLNHPGGYCNVSLLSIILYLKRWFAEIICGGVSVGVLAGNFITRTVEASRNAELVISFVAYEATTCPRPPDACAPLLRYVRLPPV